MMARVCTHRLERPNLGWVAWKDLTKKSECDKNYATGVEPEDSSLLPNAPIMHETFRPAHLGPDGRGRLEGSDGGHPRIGVKYIQIKKKYKKSLSRWRTFSHLWYFGWILNCCAFIIFLYFSHWFSLWQSSRWQYRTEFSKMECSGNASSGPTAINRHGGTMRDGVTTGDRELQDGNGWYKEVKTKHWHKWVLYFPSAE